MVCILAWLVAVAALMVADVWDETSGIELFRRGGAGAIGIGAAAWSGTLGYFRPIPVFLAGSVLHTLRPEIAWRLLRLVNAALLLGAVFLLPSIRVRGSSETSARGLALMGLVLFSGSALVTVGWYAALFDASCLFLLVASTALLTREHAVAAGALAGLAFFCKEAAILFVPWLLILLAASRVGRKQAAVAGGVAVGVGAIYFFIRSAFIPLGSTADLHPFRLADIGPTLVRFTESLLRQNLKTAGPSIFWLLVLVVVLGALPTWRLRGAVLALVACSSLLYLGMLGEYQGRRLITYQNFIGRLYLVPATFVVWAVCSEGRRFGVVALAIPVLLGGAATLRDHGAFQSTYRRLYDMARAARPAPLQVFYLQRPLVDTRRGLLIGDLPAARWRIEPETGEIVPRTP